MADCVAIVSGGMDSVTLLYYLVKSQQRRPAVISFLYGQKHDRELALAQEHAEALGCTYQLCDLSSLRDLFRSSALVSDDIPVPDIGSVKGNPQPLTYVPNRNMIFLSLVAAFAESNGVTEVFYGAQRQDMYGYWDTTAEFLARINDVYALNRKTPVKVRAPFVQWTKADILRLGLELGVDYSRTWSCYRGGETACGKCPTCAERLAAFADVGVLDPVPYFRKTQE